MNNSKLDFDNPSKFFIKGKLYTFVNRHMYESDTGWFFKSEGYTSSITPRQNIVINFKSFSFMYLYFEYSGHNGYNCYFLNDKDKVYFVHLPTPRRALKDFWVAL